MQPELAGLRANRNGHHLYLVPDRRVPRAAFLPPEPRTLHLIDVENLMGGPRSGDLTLRRSSDAYRHRVPVVPGDHVYVACNPAIAIPVGLQWPEARLLVRKGENGADLALLDEVTDIRWIAARFDRIVIGSGDGIFLHVVQRFQQVGLPVGVAAPEDHLSWRLANSAHFICLLPQSSSPESAA